VRRRAEIRTLLEAALTALRGSAAATRLAGG
jgi:hypothetical protein